MFIIPFDAIKKEMTKDDADRDLIRYRNICLKSAHDESVSKSEYDFVERFTDDVLTSYVMIHKNPKLADYYNIRMRASKHGVTPEDLDYSVMSNLFTHGLPISYKDIDFDAIKSFGYIPAITKIISNNPDTVVFFNDGTKEIVTCETDEEFDAKLGVLYAILKKAVGNRHFQQLFKLINNAIKTAKPDKVRVEKDIHIDDQNDTNKNVSINDSNDMPKLPLAE